MIFGIGTDILRIERVASTYARFGDHFVRRLLMPEELARFQPQKNAVRYLAMRFAAKEAIVKAMGTGFAYGMWLRDCGVVADPRGRPGIVFSARGRALCGQMGISAEGGHLSLSDEAGLVVAVAVLMQAHSMPTDPTSLPR
jgi:holo-[acyl-carrier protein] synthase